ncbi:methyltransferase [Rhodococcus erythropolis]|nr:HemK2/MTQ2 family protein methyltransferase [Rhodococcus erythropolis]MBT2264350.1 methyltransferase [Rhodococcus erythropolis]
MIVCLPGVYPPQDDTSLLIEALNNQVLVGSTRVLDLCAGTGALSIAAAEAGAGRVLAIDISRRAIANVRINSLLNNVSVEARRGDLAEAAHGEMFDLVVSNPPYVPSEIDDLPTAGLERAWNAGTSGRVLLDRIITSAPDVLAPGGSLLLLQSALCDVGKSEAMLEELGLTVEVVAQKSIPFGPVLRSRRSMLERRGVIDRGQETEDLVVLRAVKPLPAVRKGSDAVMAPIGATERSLRQVDNAPRQARLRSSSEVQNPSGECRDSVNQLRKLLTATGFRIVDTLSTRTDTGIRHVFTLAPKGRVVVLSDSRTEMTEVELQIEHVGSEVAEYLRNHLPESILRKVRILVEQVNGEQLAHSTSEPHAESARESLERTENE